MLLSSCYIRLKDEHDLVRKNAVMVLTHLILNDMIKIRGRISAMALCLEDTNTSIVALAKAFFSELSQKVSQLSMAILIMIFFFTFEGK